MLYTLVNNAAVVKFSTLRLPTASGLEVHHRILQSDAFVGGRYTSADTTRLLTPLIRSDTGPLSLLKPPSDCNPCTTTTPGCARAVLPPFVVCEDEE